MDVLGYPSLIVRTIYMNVIGTLKKKIERNMALISGAVCKSKWMSWATLP